MDNLFSVVLEDLVIQSLQWLEYQVYLYTLFW